MINISYGFALVNDRAGKNRARPNRAGSVNFTEGSAEPARPSLDQNWPNLKPKIDQKCSLVSVQKKVKFKY